MREALYGIVALIALAGGITAGYFSTASLSGTLEPYASIEKLNTRFTLYGRISAVNPDTQVLTFTTLDPYNGQDTDTLFLLYSSRTQLGNSGPVGADAAAIITKKYINQQVSMYVERTPNGALYTNLINLPTTQQKKQ